MSFAHTTTKETRRRPTVQIRRDELATCQKSVERRAKHRRLVGIHGSVDWWKTPNYVFHWENLQEGQSRTMMADKNTRTKRKRFFSHFASVLHTRERECFFWESETHSGALLSNGSFRNYTLKIKWIINSNQKLHSEVNDTKWLCTQYKLRDFSFHWFSAVKYYVILVKYYLVMDNKSPNFILCHFIYCFR